MKKISIFCITMACLFCEAASAQTAHAENSAHSIPPIFAGIPHRTFESNPPPAITCPPDWYYSPTHGCQSFCMMFPQAPGCTPPHF